METENAHTYLTVILPNCYSSEEVQHQALNLLFVYSETIYTLSQKNVPSLTGYRLNILQLNISIAVIYQVERRHIKQRTLSEKCVQLSVSVLASRVSSLLSQL